MGRLFLPSVIQFINRVYCVAWSRFRAVYFSSKGVSATTLGQLKGVGLIMKVVGSTAWGILSDVTDSPKNMLVLSTILSCFALHVFQHDFVFSSVSTTFFAYALYEGVNVITMLTDSLCLLMLPNKNDYGTARMWCAISHGISSLAVGWCMDQWGVGVIFQWSYVAAVIVLYVTVFHIPNVSQKKKSDVKSDSDEPKPTFAETFFIAIKHPPLLLCLVDLFSYGFLMCVPELVLFVQLENEFKVPRVVYGACVWASTLTELPVFFFSDHILSEYSRQSCFFVSRIALLLRVFAYSFMTSDTYQYILVVQFVHGLCFALNWITIMKHAHEMAPEGISTSVQSLVSVAYFYMGQGLGGMFWTRCYDEYGSNFTYMGAVGGTGVLLLVESMFPVWGYSQRKKLVQTGAEKQE